MIYEPDSPTYVSSAPVPSTPVEEGGPNPPVHVSSTPDPSDQVPETVYCELWDVAEDYDGLHPYTNQDAVRQPYAEFAPRARDVSMPNVDSADVSAAVPMGEEDGAI